MWTGLTDSPGVTVELGDRCARCGHCSWLTRCGWWNRAPGTGSRSRVPVNGPLPGLPGPGVTGACSEYTGRLTGDC